MGGPSRQISEGFVFVSFLVISQSVAPEQCGNAPQLFLRTAPVKQQRNGRRKHGRTTIVMEMGRRHRRSTHHAKPKHNKLEPSQNTHAFPSALANSNQQTPAKQPRSATYVLEGRRPIIIGFRIPKAPGANSHALVLALAERHLAHELVPRNVTFLCEE